MPTFFERFTNSFKAYSPEESLATRVGDVDALKALTIQGFGLNQEYYGADLGPRFHIGGVDPFANIGDLWKNSAIAACIQWIARTLPEAPLVVKKDSTSGSTIVNRHPLSTLWARPNSLFSGEIVLSGLIISLCVSGNGYLHIVRSGAGVPVELNYLPHFAVMPVSANGNLIDHYEYEVSNRKIDLPEADVIHLRIGIDPRDMRFGLSPLAAAIREVATDNEATMFAYAMLKNMGVPGVVISPNDANTVIEPEQAELIKQKWAEKVTGQNRGSALVLPTPLTLDQFGISPKDMLVDRLHDLPESRICALLGVPAMVVGLSSAANTKTYANYSEAREAAWHEALLPLMRSISTQLDIQLLPFMGDVSTEHVGFDTSEVAALQDDLDAAAVRVSTLWDSGLCRLGEARSVFGFDAIPEYDKLFKAELDAKLSPTPDPASQVPPPPVPVFREGVNRIS